MIDLKKMLPGIILLSILLFACAANSVYLNSRLSNMKELISLSSTLPDEEANIKISECNKQWENIKYYANFVLRENICDEIDALLIELTSNPSNPEIKKLLISKLESTIYMESVSISSIF